MILNKYLNDIKGLHNLEHEIGFELENIVTKILMPSNKLEFQLTDLFQKSNNSTEIILNNEMLHKIEQTLNLIFINEEKNQENVCLANSSELRKEYRQSFKLIDLLDYICAFVYSVTYKESGQIVISEADLFWQLIKTGISLRKDNK